MNIQYVYTKGPYIEFRGYPFVNGKPTIVQDKATQDALDKRADFKRHEPTPPAVFRRPIIRARKAADII